MKSIFNKLSALFVCGAVAIVGCSDFSADLKDVNQRLEDLTASAATKTEVEVLAAELEDLIAEFGKQYATKGEVAQVVSAISTVKTYVEASIAKLDATVANKADKAEVEAAIAGLEEALQTAKDELNATLDGIEEELGDLAAEDNAIKASVTEVIEDVEALQGDVQTLSTNLDELEGALEATVADVEAVTKRLSTLETAFEEYKAQVDAELLTINAELATIKTNLDTKFNTVLEKISGLETADETLSNLITEKTEELSGLIAAVNTLLAEKVALLVATDEDLQSQIDDLAAKYDVLVENDELLAAQDEILAAQDEALAAEIEDLVEAYDEFAADVEDQFDAVYDEFDAVYDEVDAIWDEIDGIITDMALDYKDLEERLAALEDAFAELDYRVDVLENELRSIVNVPQVVINGVNSVEFKSLTFVPMDEAADAETIVLPTYAYFRFNPSSFVLANAEYSVVTENVEFRTKAAEESLAIVSVAEEDGKVKVELARGAGVDNMFALAATLKSNNAVIYSDYVQIVDTKLTAEDVKIVDVNNSELYTVLEYAQNNPATVAIEVGETFSVAEYVKVLGLDMEEFGLELTYDVVKGQAEIADGVLTAVEAASATNNIVKVEVVSNGSVVRRAYINVRVIGLVTYINAEVTANLSASRWVYSFENISEWVKTLKDQPNTLELVKSALQSVMSQDYFGAISTLGGIPGFAIETISVEGTGAARVKVDFTAAGYIESQLDKISEIKSVEELAAYIQYVEAIYMVSGLKNTVDEALGTVIDYLVPDQYKDNQIYEWVKEQLLNWTVSSLFNFEEDIIADIPLVGVVNVSSWAREKINGVLNSNSALTQKLKNALVDVVSEIEQAYRENVDANNATAEELAYNYAKSTALLEAKVAAKTEADKNLEVVNAAEVANLNDGVFGSLVKILNSDFCKTQFEENGLADVYTTLQTICGYAEDFVQYSAGSCEFSGETVAEEQVYE